MAVSGLTSCLYRPHWDGLVDGVWRAAQRRLHCRAAGRKLLWTTLLTGVVCHTSMAWAQQPAKAAPLKVSSAVFVTDEWHDLTRKDGTGLYLELITAVFARQGVQVTYRTYPYARAVQQVKDHQADGWVASFMKEKSFPLYPQYHFDKNEQTIVYVKKKQKAPVSLGSLRNQRVAWLRDFGLDRFIREPMRINELDTIESAFQMLEKDRIDYFVGAKSDIEDYIQNKKQDMTPFGMAYAMHLGLYMAFADTARGAKLRDMWDAEMSTFHTSEAFKAIYKKYGYPYPFP